MNRLAYYAVYIQREATEIEVIARKLEDVGYHDVGSTVPYLEDLQRHSASLNALAMAFAELVGVESSGSEAPRSGPAAALEPETVLELEASGVPPDLDEPLYPPSPDGLPGAARKAPLSPTPVEGAAHPFAAVGPEEEALMAALWACQRALEAGGAPEHMAMSLAIYMDLHQGPTVVQSVARDATLGRDAAARFSRALEWTRDERADQPIRRAEQEAWELILIGLERELIEVV